MMPGAIFYLSNPNYDPLDGVVKNLVWTHLPTMSTYIMGNMYCFKIKPYLIFSEIQFAYY